MKLLLLVLCAVGVRLSLCFRCDRIPEGRVPPQSIPDGRFEVKIAGNPSLYVPGQVYTVTIEGTTVKTELDEDVNQFIGFMVVAQPRENSPISLGSFEPVDSLSKYNDRCQNSITQSSLVPKSGIQVYWTAPPTGSGCVTIKATIVENKDRWYKDGIYLNKDLCEDLEESPEIQPPMMDRCCACDEAKYEVVFEGLWSRQTHPKNFPNNSWEAKFSDVIGASHSPEYQFWQYGKPAGEGLHEVAAEGTTKMLESEFKNVSNHIRTIIKARGISYPNVTAKTFAVFRVNNKHHLISLVSKIIPSPDWIVGVSGLELCLTNCTWAEKKELSLYPWDAGTEDGISYKSPPIPTQPRDIIRRISTSFPAHPDSPFFDDQGGKMNPLGRLYITRQRLYEKTCNSSYGTPDNSLEDTINVGPCKVGLWKDWAPCTVSCGRGTKQQRRFYSNEMEAKIRNCNRPLVREVKCVRRCLGDITDVSVDPYCELTDWSEFSTCSSKCGEGTRTRDRTYVRRNAEKFCTKGKFYLPILQDNEKCTGEQCDDNELQEVYEKPGCEMTPWTNWTPCSKSCGTGIKTRRRSRLNPPEESDKAKRSSGRRHGSRRQAEEEDGEDEEEEDTDYSEDPCLNVKVEEVVECVASSCDLDPEEAKIICQEPKDTGNCGGNNNYVRSTDKWYFDTLSEQCQTFNYSGCGGNRNNFDSKEECEQACSTYENPINSGNFQVGNHILDRGSFSNDYRRQYNRGRTESEENRSDNQIYDNDQSDIATNEVVNCQVSKWSDWSTCSVSCGSGYRYRYRQILAYPQNGGKACPTKLKRKHKCIQNNCFSFDK